MTEEEIAILEGFRDFFTEALVSFKPGVVTQDGKRAMAFAFIDARAVMDRLDTVLGCLRWQDCYDRMDDGSYRCSLSVLINTTWITKQGMSSIPGKDDDSKDMESQSLKRAAVKYGIARYLYEIQPQWQPYDSTKKKWATEPTLPMWALPDTRRLAMAALRPCLAEGLASLKKCWQSLQEEQRLSCQDLLPLLKMQANGHCEVPA